MRISLIAVLVAALLRVDAADGPGATLTGTVYDCTPTDYPVQEIADAARMPDKAAAAAKVDALLAAVVGSRRPVPGAVLTLSGPSGTVSCTSAGDGGYALAGVAPGTYAFSLAAAVVASPSSLTIPDKARSGTIDVAIRRDPLVIAGSVVDAQAKAVAGARVTAAFAAGAGEGAPGGEISVLTDGAGRFVLPMMAPLGVVEAMKHLIGGDPSEGGKTAYYLRISASSGALRSDQVEAPLMNQDTLRFARSVIAAMKVIHAKSSGDSPFFREGRPAPVFTDGRQQVRLVVGTGR